MASSHVEDPGDGVLQVQIRCLQVAGGLVCYQAVWDLSSRRNNVVVDFD
jgi:hypothetical protein